MPSWVVPTVAAEYWGVSVEQVMSEIAAGRIPSRTEGSFTFVDVDPSAEVPAAPVARPAYRRPLTWTPITSIPVSQAVVTSAERDALLEGADKTTAEDSDYVTPDADAPDPEALTADDIPNWDEVRARIGRTRRPPPMSDAA